MVVLVGQLRLQVTEQELLFFLLPTRQAHGGTVPAHFLLGQMRSHHCHRWSLLLLSQMAIQFTEHNITDKIIQLMQSIAASLLLTAPEPRRIRSHRTVSVMAHYRDGTDFRGFKENSHKTHALLAIATRHQPVSWELVPRIIPNPYCGAPHPSRGAHRTITKTTTKEWKQFP